ncbi:hypothetical protein [Pseudarthrobacter sp. NS4]|uniref:hypothetical protein n=1 Tax=Pseudarthrobacter sp. NS4 TaxID=2973976 RepID=UPI002161B534|nr:hypothetical protein [Pseudarthrobacter sp. NS4]
MSHPHFEVFLAQAIDEERHKEDGLSPDELYGLYTSWCLLNREEAQAPEALWEALKAHRIKPGHNHVGMKGPAAANYIIASAPDLV